MRGTVLSAVFLLVVTACSEKAVLDKPAAQPLTREAIGYFCGMIVTDHPGPKGQIHLKGKAETLWFSSVRDTLAFTRLPEETDPITAIYVTDVGSATSWDNPGGAWIDAQDAVFVVGSSKRGGMGAPEVVPFLNEADAENFASDFGGNIMKLDDIPYGALLGAWENVPEMNHGKQK